MRKEIIIAIVVGLVLALLITVAVNRASLALRRSPANTGLDSSTEATPTPTPGETKTSLAIHNPEDGLVQKERSVIVTGSTDPNSQVILLVNNDDLLSTSDAAGNFSFTAPLKDGGNLLTIFVLKDDGSSLTEQRTVIVGEYPV